jgi:transketolase
VPDGVPERWQARVAANQEARTAWQRRLSAYAEAEPQLAAEFKAALAGELPAGWDTDLDAAFAEPAKMATRKASQRAINAIAPNLPTLVGGSADLAESNLTDIASGGDLTATEAGRNLRFGVREHGMGAISNGLAVHGGLRPFCATFLVFSDYMRPSVRLAALMGLPVVYVWTHDSIGLGGDGPTHQPIEHLGSLRLIPNLHVIRPADGPETAEAWRAALRRTDGPTALVLSRQELPPQDRDEMASAAGLQRGAYVMAEASDGDPELILIATGSELWVALSARAELEQREEIRTRVVSMPCWELFEAQPQSYQEQVLPPEVTSRLAVEAGSTAMWRQWVGHLGGVVGIDRYGASAPGGQLLQRFGFTPDNVVEHALAVLHREHIEKARMLRNLSA